VLIHVTLRRIRVTIVAVEKYKVLHTLCVCVALVIQHRMRKRRYYIVIICGMSGSTMFFHSIP
jgi:hypothetical protein